MLFSESSRLHGLLKRPHAAQPVLQALAQEPLPAAFWPTSHWTLQSVTDAFRLSSSSVPHLL